jgi:elongator complex protein 3
MVPVGENAKKCDWQHRGYGAELLNCAEEVTKDAGFKKISVISGIGAREYYRRQGYMLDGVYMSKWF